IRIQSRFGEVQASAEGSGQILSPMPGKVLKLLVKLNDTVEAGDTLALMEAMKMELSIKSDIAGVIQQIYIVDGELIEADTVMLEIEAVSD
ncbi:MAG: acetyl-CoA carboxylase biotin carboxyl carrier protein subunit, partial [Pseudomonadota bacterium]